MRKIVTAFAALAMAGGVFALTGPSSAANTSQCVSKGVVNMYAVPYEDIELPVGGVQDTFDTAVCRFGNDGKIRVYKSVANTSRELAVLRAWAEKVSSPDFPTLVCTTNEGGYFLDLAQHYTVGPDAVSAYEWDHYASFIQRRATNNSNCTIYS